MDVVLKEKELEGLKNLARFMCKHWKDLDEKRYKTMEIASNEKACKTRDFLIMQWPIIQGTNNQIKLNKIGKQDIDFKSITDGVNYLLK